jgi:hypothetical protein
MHGHHCGRNAPRQRQQTGAHADARAQTQMRECCSTMQYHAAGCDGFIYREVFVAVFVARANGDRCSSSSNANKKPDAKSRPVSKAKHERKMARSSLEKIGREITSDF